VTNSGHDKSDSKRAARQSVNSWDAAFIDGLYAKWSADPESVDQSWRQFFAGFDLGLSRPAPTDPLGDSDDVTRGAPDQTFAAQTTGAGAAVDGQHAEDQRRVDALINRYREFGHLAATIDPLGTTRPFPDALTLESLGLNDGHLAQHFDAGTLPIASPSTLGAIIDQLERTYCGHCGVEYMHLSNLEQRQWLERRIEQTRGRWGFGPEQQRRILARIVDADAFESFLAMRYVGKKRFGLDGAETLIPMIDSVLETGAALGAREFCFAFAHRGRVSLLCNGLGKSYEQILTEFEESWTDSFARGGGDVKYHLGFSGSRTTASGEVHVSASANASHLEFINAVVLGRTRAKQDLRSDSERREVIPVLVHGDSSFPGQGSVAECFNFMLLKGYAVGGALHIIINNQVGFTTNPECTFGGSYCSDLAKGFGVPVFHVNGSDPEACVWAVQMAVEFRQAFGVDALVELWCYRKNGHNETDEPSFTQPLLYKRIRSHTPVATSYRDRLVAQSVLTADEADALPKLVHERMDAAQTAVRAKPVRPNVPPFANQWKGLSHAYAWDHVETGVPLASLVKVAATLSKVPDHITPHKTIARLIAARGKVDSDTRIDWALAELLAYGTLLQEGKVVRISGQDVERGTFSHRHAVAICQETAGTFSPLSQLGRFEVCNSPLTENAIVGFETGYAQVDPDALVIWEAQFGDFANGAQVIFDQFLTSAEIKWDRACGLVMLLPHGYEGQGPEHSSARLERILQLAADDNLECVYPTTTAQVFHLLRRQLKRPFRKPLFVMTPKSMLRLPAAQSAGEELVQGHFERVLDDAEAQRGGMVSRVYFCSGKIFHELDAQRRELGDRGSAFVRLEQIAPFPAEEVEAVLKRYRGGEMYWVQEEPRNMGAFRFVQSQMLDRFGVNLKYIGRPDSATPAVGSTKVHEKQAKALLMDVFPALATAMKARDDNKPAATAASESDNKSADRSKTTDRATADTSEPKSKRSGTGRRTTAQKR
jgi:2-oxoglutarate dehydrogenase E1 component